MVFLFVRGEVLRLGARGRGARTRPHGPSGWLARRPRRDSAYGSTDQLRRREENFDRVATTRAKAPERARRPARGSDRHAAQQRGNCSTSSASARSSVRPRSAHAAPLRRAPDAGLVPARASAANAPFGVARLRPRGGRPRVSFAAYAADERGSRLVGAPAPMQALSPQSLSVSLVRRRVLPRCVVGESIFRCAGSPRRGALAVLRRAKWASPASTARPQAKQGPVRRSRFFREASPGCPGGQGQLTGPPRRGSRPARTAAI